MKRFVVALIAGAAVFALAFGSASVLTMTGGTIQAGEDTTLYCDTDGVHVAGWGLETDGALAGTVGSVRINGLTGCEGNDLFVNVTDGTGAVLTDEAAPVTIDADEESVAFQTRVNASAIEDIHVFIEGPVGVTP